MGPARPSFRQALSTGFSIIEVVGVLAVMAILALTLVPALLRHIDTEAKKREASALSQLSVGLREYILGARRIPAANTVFSDVAGELGWQLAAATTNPRGRARLYLVDPAFSLGTNTAATLPYVQGIYGATNLTGTRFLFVSGMGGALPDVLTNPGTNATAVFEMLWNAPDFTTPAGWAWGGNWQDIQLQRLSLLPHFSQVILNNASTTVGHFSIDNTNTHVALPSIPFSAFYFTRTVLGLHATAGDLQALQVLQDATSITNAAPYYLCPSFVYEKGIWRGKLFMGTDAQKHSGQDLQAAYEIFMSGPANVYHVGGVNQQSVTWSMYLFMSNYVVWANSGFSSATKPALVSSQATLAAELATYCNKKASVN